MAAVTAALALLALAPSAAEAARAVPRGFWGANWDGAVRYKASVQTKQDQWGQMAASGVESQRASFLWSAAQPNKGDRIRFKFTDELVRLAVSHGIDLLPVVFQAPRWARQSARANAPPRKRKRKAYGRYLRALIERYGPNGTFWTANPLLAKRPIRKWQLWNEPSADYQWDIAQGKDWAPGYAALLKIAYRAIKKADPGARVVLAGLPNTSWTDLDHLYKKGKVRGYFDVAAVHPYTAKPGGVLTIVKRFRSVMKKHGDGSKQVLVTELGLPASQGKTSDTSPLQTTDDGMANFLQRSYADLAANRAKLRVTRVYWYTWASVYDGWIFNWTGLFRYARKHKHDTFEEKPAFGRYRKLALAAEGCTAKSTTGACLP